MEKKINIMEEKLSIVKKMEDKMLLTYFSKYSKKDLFKMDSYEREEYMMIQDEILNRMSNK